MEATVGTFLFKMMRRRPFECVFLSSIRTHAALVLCVSLFVRTYVRMFVCIACFFLSDYGAPAGGGSSGYYGGSSSGGIGGAGGGGYYGGGQAAVAPSYGSSGGGTSMNREKARVILTAQRSD